MIYVDRKEKRGENRKRRRGMGYKVLVELATLEWSNISHAASEPIARW